MSRVLEPLFSHSGGALCMRTYLAGWLERTHRREPRQPRQPAGIGLTPSELSGPELTWQVTPKCMSEPGQHHMEESAPSHLSPAQTPDPQGSWTTKLLWFVETLNFGVFGYVTKTNGKSRLSLTEHKWSHLSLPLQPQLWSNQWEPEALARDTGQSCSSPLQSMLWGEAGAVWPFYHHNRSSPRMKLFHERLPENCRGLESEAWSKSLSNCTGTSHLLWAFIIIIRAINSLAI